ncbi:Zinc ABC transporter permease subunit ZnuB [Candidatus Hepatincolaceae symbiont of Richtersius coronifer]
MHDLIILAIIGGIGLCLSLSVLGNFIIWNRLSYLGDSIAHSSLLGIAIGLLIPGASYIAIILICFISSFLLILLNKKLNIAKDALLIFNTQFALALGITLISLLNPSKMANTYFIGNIISLTLTDIIFIYMVSSTILVYLYIFWDKLLLLAVNEELATSENINSFIHNIAFTFMLSCLIVFGIKLAGILLIPSLMIIPGLIALGLTRTPFSSLIVSFFLATIAVIIGVLLSIIIDAPTGPLITLVLVGFMGLKIIPLLFSKLFNN